MNRLKMDWKEYLKDHKQVDYLIVDPPWNFDDKPPRAVNQLKYDLWKNNVVGIKNLFRLSEAQYLFVWIPNSLLDVLLALSITSKKYKFKTLITWVKMTKGGKYHYGLGHWLRNATEQLVVFAKEVGSKKAKPIKFNTRNVHHGQTRPKTGKPRKLELEIIEQLSAKGYTAGAYIFSGVDETGCFKRYDIDLIDVGFEHEV